jgi:23S rRNA (adenine2503-C2)-methyltransferase
MWAYTLLADQNDATEDALALAELALRFASKFGASPRLSLIPYNTIEGASFERSARARSDAFREALLSRGVGAILRYSGGGDVGAACGQLVRERVASERKRAPSLAALDTER